MKVLITGARSGIGFAVGKVLLTRGHDVVFTTHTEEQSQALRQEGYQSMVLDITKPVDPTLFQEIDVLFCNAAIGVGGSILDLPIDRLRENFEVNVFHNFRLIQLALDQMLSKGSGTVVIMSSLVADMPVPFLSSYSATKAAIKSLAITLRKELKKISTGVHIKLIQPGAYHTGFNQLMINQNLEFDQPHYERQIEEIVRMTNLEFRLLEPHKLDSIVRKIVRAIETDSSRFLYKAPFYQSFFTKLYQIFCK